MKLSAAIIATLALSGCLVKDSSTKSIADEIEEHKQVELAYLNFELEGEGENAGESLLLNLEIKKNALATCELNEVKICVVGSKKAQLMSYKTFRLFSPHSPTKPKSPTLQFASKPNTKQMADLMAFSCTPDGIVSIRLEAGWKTKRSGDGGYTKIGLTPAHIFNYVKETSQSDRDAKLGRGKKFPSQRDEGCFPKKKTTTKAN